jgi:hypothetical protein
MKKLLQITLAAIFVIFSLQTTRAQTLEENKTDDFTNNKVKRTSWETVNETMSFSAYFRISQINSDTFFDLKLMIGGKVFSVKKDQELMFKLENGEVVKLANLEYTITCKGCGARGFIGSAAEGAKMSYLIDKDQLEKLKTSKVVKLRIYTSDGYVENDIKEKNSKKIQTAILLL